MSGVEVHRVDPATWKELASNAHKAVFNDIRDADFDKVDFALLTSTTNGSLLGYITCRELDAETLAWDFGGSFDHARYTYSWSSYKACLGWVKGEGYDRIVTHIENVNTVMLKFALKIGFIIQGIVMHRGRIYVEMHIELKQGV